MGDLMEAEQKATSETLIKRGRPVRIFYLSELQEQEMGALLMHYLLETIITAKILGLDAFDQPAVEEGKILTRNYLEST
jgi:glucose-6-phosphate isomerase